MRNQDIKPDLSGKVLVTTDLSGATFIETDLSGAVLYNGNFFNMDFRRASLRNADLSNTDLRRVTLQGADLSGANLILANLVDADLAHTNFANVMLGWTIFGNNDLSSVEGLETVHHIFPSTIGIDTVYRSEGRIPEVFLRGTGAPENFITYMRSLTSQALEFYQCFISFTEADDAFSAKLYKDLQGCNVRCWIWKEDAKWGQTLMRSIDEAIRHYDKLVVVCSESSLNSPAVIREIERALQKEDEIAKQGSPNDVLFPLSLDNYVFEKWDHHRKADVIAKYVGDFRGWREPESYRRALERLVRDLHAPAG